MSNAKLSQQPVQAADEAPAQVVRDEAGVPLLAAGGQKVHPPGGLLSRTGSRSNGKSGEE